MAQIKPFRGMRFSASAGQPRELCCPPYDIISEQQRQAFLATNPHNIIRLELPREGENPYETAANVLSSWLADGTLKRDDNAAIYLYEEAFTVRGTAYRFRGFISAVHLEEFSAGVVLPHEETLSAAKQDRFDLMCATGCNFSQVYSLYDDANGACKAILDKLAAGEPTVEFTDAEGVTHRLWVAEDGADVQALCALFADKKLYIADGHHRYETALNYHKHLVASGAETGTSDSIMMFLCDLQNAGLVVFPTHRVIHNIEGFAATDFLAKAAKYFDVRPLASFDEIEGELSAVYAQGGKAFGFYDGENASLLTMRDLSVMADIMPGASEALRSLDVTLLHTLLLEPLCGIDKKAMAAGGKLTYTRDAAEAKALAEGDANACFILNPTRVSEISAVALAGEKMPQKSTYFYPKLITGLVMNKML